MVNGALARGRIILVATDLMRESRIAEGARALGYEVQSIDLFRERLATATRQHLREEVLVLRWPGR